MYKIYSSIKKELLLLWSDKVGLVLMFVMPLFLVFVITIIQDSAYKMVNENKIPVVVVNKDKGSEGQKLVKLFKESGLFELDENTAMKEESLKAELLASGKLIAVLIPEGFTEALEYNAADVSSTMMEDLGLEHPKLEKGKSGSPAISFYHDPVLQENYSQSVMGIIYQYMSSLENGLVIDKLYEDMDFDVKPDKIKEKMFSQRIKVDRIVATSNDSNQLPNSTQHNVPAWTIFAMFFMVVSLGANIVKERVSGSFLRLRTMPTSFIIVISSKMAVYLVVALLQVVLIFSMGVTIFPRIGLPELTLPDRYLPFVSVVFLSSFAAVSYALMIGALAKTQEQANGFGALSIIIFGVIGGIWVPTFVMPDYMQFVSSFSPLHWCLEGFYVLFLKGGSWNELKNVLVFLGLFIAICQLAAYIKLKIEKII
jgi:ABC-2 type transport system permease protein